MALSADAGFGVLVALHSIMTAVYLLTALKLSGLLEYGTLVLGGYCLAWDEYSNDRRVGSSISIVRDALHRYGQVLSPSQARKSRRKRNINRTSISTSKSFHGSHRLISPHPPSFPCLKSTSRSDPQRLPHPDNLPNSPHQRLPICFRPSTTTPLQQRGHLLPQSHLQILNPFPPRHRLGVQPRSRE